MKAEELVKLIEAATPLILGIAGGAIALTMVITKSDSQIGETAVIAALTGSAGTFQTRIRDE